MRISRRDALRAGCWLAGGAWLRAAIGQAAAGTAPPHALSPIRMINGAASAGLNFVLRNSAEGRKYQVETLPGGLGVIGLPHLDAGPFLSYGIQWIAFGILAPIGLGYFLVSEIRQRRREKAQDQAQAASQKAGAPLTTEEKLADRYGRRR